MAHLVGELKGMSYGENNPDSEDEGFGGDLILVSILAGTESLDDATKCFRLSGIICQVCRKR